MQHADGWVREDEAHVQVHINTYIYRLYDALRMCTCGMVSKQNYVMSTSTASIECSCNYISKVLFTSPSWYLFTISIGHIIICRWAVPPMFAFKSKRMWLAQWIWCVFQFERRVYHLRWQVLQICCTDCRIDETCARHATQCGVVPKTTLVMFIRND